MVVAMRASSVVDNLPTFTRRYLVASIAGMKTPYIPHLFGADALANVKGAKLVRTGVPT